MLLISLSQISSVLSAITIAGVHRFSQVLIYENANYAEAAKAFALLCLAYSPMVAVVVRTETLRDEPTVPSVVCVTFAAIGTYMNQ